MTAKLISKNKVHGGWHQRYEHQSAVNNCTMTFAVFIPDTVDNTAKAPVFYWLSGLTCTDENFMQKANAFAKAAELKVVLVAPDTSPRGEDVADDEQGAYDFGLGAGFYVNATQAPFAKHYQMYDYIVHELPQLVKAQFPVTDKWAISGHSMGGHGALTIGLKNPQLFTSISAFAPIASPLNCPWGEKALGGYLGNDKDLWQQYDSAYLLSQADASEVPPILVTQGLADNFLDEQLKPELLTQAAKQSNVALTLEQHEGYDHSYFFIQSFIEQHLDFHFEYLK